MRREATPAVRVADARRLQSRYELLREQVRATAEELEALEAAATPRLQELGRVLSPLHEKMLTQRRELLERVEEALCSPDVGTRLKCSLEEIALALGRVLAQLAGGPVDADPTHDELKPTASDPATHRPRPAAEPTNPDALRKRLYLGLARQLHPDKGALGVESMQKLNAAYAAQDMRSLLELHHAHSEEAPAADPLTLEALCDELEEQRVQVRRRRAQILAWLPEFQGPWQTLLENPKRWKRTLRASRIQAEEEVARFKELLRATRELPDLIRFAKGLDPTEYGQYF